MNKVIFYLIVILLTIYATAFGQLNDHEKEMSSALGMPQNVEMGAYKSIHHTQKIDIGHSGQLSLNIPLMTVPGRNGLNFPLTAGYSSGIRVFQEASWIGLGWSLNIGSVIRKVNYKADYFSSNTHPEMMDIFNVSMPGGSQRIYNFGTVSAPDFATEEDNGWKIECSTPIPLGDNGYDIDWFIITSVDGMRYVFNKALPGYSIFRVATGEGVSMEIGAGNNEWALTAILGSDYVDGLGDDLWPLDSPNPSIDNKGTWIAIIYNNDNHLKYYNPNHDYQNSQSPSITHSLTACYPFRVITPTHVAEFEWEDENPNIFSENEIVQEEGYLGEPNDPGNEVKKRITKIHLYKYDGTGQGDHSSNAVQTIQFEYAPANEGLAARWTNASYTKTTLNKIFIKNISTGEQLPPYEFFYVTHNPTVRDYLSFQGDYLKDDWIFGNYNSLNPASSNDCASGDAEAWDLNKIKYPYGGTITFTYQDAFHVLYYWPWKHSHPANSARRGFSTVATQTIDDGVSSPQTYTYLYGSDADGHGHQYLPTTLYWVDVQIVQAGLSAGFRNIFYDASDLYMTYDKITETLPGDNGKIVRYYTSTRDITLDYGQRGSSDVDIYNNTLRLRGLLTKIEYYNGSSQLVKKIEYNTVENIVKVCKPWGIDPIYFSVSKQSEDVFTTTYSTDGTTAIVDTISTLYILYGLPYRIIEKNNGIDRVTRITYPFTYYSSIPSSTTDANAYSIRRMYEKNILNKIIEKTTLFNTNPNEQFPENEGKVISSDLMLYNKLVDGRVYPSEYLKFEFDHPVEPTGAYPGFMYASYNHIISAFVYDPRYKRQNLMTAYDNYGNLIESYDANDTKISTKWGYDFTRPVAQVSNAINSEIGFADFEDNTEGDWDDWTNGSGGNTAHTGKFGWHFNSTDQGHIFKKFYDFDLDETGKYIFSGWIKSSYSNPGVLQWYISYNNGSSSSYPETVLATGTGNWEYLELPIDLSSYQNIEYIYLIARNHNGTSYSNCDFDDLQFYPMDAQMTTYTYDPATLTLTSQSDANSIPTYYEYDGLRRFTAIRNYNNELLESYSYELKGSLISSTNPNFITNLSYRTVSDYTTTKSFFDGLGRKVQSQINLGSGLGIVSHQTYDELGRLEKTYKPYEYQTSLSYDADANVNTHASDYYNNNVYNGSAGTFTDYYPYILQKYYDDGRIENIIPEGTEWHNSNYIQYSYGSNVSGDNTDYEVGTLNKTSIIDENGVKKLKFRDKLENFVQSVNDSEGLKLTTKYKYDILGNMTESVPPNGPDYKTTYTYNTLSQLTEKVSPDAGTVDYLYDKNGNLRFIQDANHPGSSINSVNINQIINNGQTLNGNFTLGGKGEVSFYLYYPYIPSGYIKIEIKTSSNVVLGSITATSSNPGASSTLILPKGTYNYTFQSTVPYYIYCRINCQANLLFTYSKYDKLNRVIETGEFNGNSSSYFSQTNADISNFPTNNSFIVSKKYFYDTPSTDPLAAGQRNLKGRISYTESYRLGTLEVRTFYSYDEMGRVEWVVHYNLGSYQKKLTYSYDLQGNITQKVYRDYTSSLSAYTQNTYDEASRLNTVKTSYFPPGNYTQDASYLYFASGKVKRLQLGNAQGIDYRYNERDWVTMINHQNLNTSQDPGNDGPGGSGVAYTDKFGMVIDYNRIGHIGATQSAQKQWNGNISWLMYSMKDVFYTGTNGTTDLVGSTYSYDNVNRLRNADFGYYSGNPGNWYTTDAYDEVIPDVSGNPIIPGYDDNGNIMALQRYNSSGNLLDNFTYNYAANKNRLSSITGSSSATYTYDDNGNVTGDSHSSRNIAFVIYDIDNLPVTVYKTDGEQQRYYYDVNGNRVRKSVVGSSNTYYLNSYDGRTEAVSHVSTGSDFTYNIWGNDMVGQLRVTSGTTSTPYYYLKDHLGSIRMTVNSAGAVVGYDDYYPFGKIMPNRSYVSSADYRFRFTSKERDVETGYDYFGARYYDSRIGRWLSVDPRFEKYHNISPYTYVFNNPLRFTDPHGDTVNIDPQLLNPVVTEEGKSKSRGEMTPEEIHKTDFQTWWNENKETVEGLFGIGAKYESTAINFNLGTMPYPKPSLFNLFNLFARRATTYSGYDALTTFGTDGMDPGNFDRGGNASGPLNMPVSNLVFNVWFNPNVHKLSQNAANHEWSHVSIIFDRVKNNLIIPNGAEQHLLMNSGRTPIIK